MHDETSVERRTRDEKVARIYSVCVFLIGPSRFIQTTIQLKYIVHFFTLNYIYFIEHKKPNSRELAIHLFLSESQY